MNIVTPFPTNIPINTVNVTTESARRDNQLREVIAKPAGNEAGAAERGVASDHDKSNKSQNPNSFEANLRDAEDGQKIQEREQGRGDQQSDQEKQAQKQLEEAKQAEQKAEQKIAQVEQQQVTKLKSRDAEVRAHEQAHAATGGQYAGSPTYSFKRGPDGNNYAVGGEVSISTSAIAGDPAGTIRKMQQVRAAALAPAEPSGQDRKVAAGATQQISKARADEVKQTAAEAKEKVDETKAKAEEAKAEKAEEEKSLNADGTDGSDKSQAAQKAADPFNLLAEDEDTAIAVNGSTNASGVNNTNSGNRRAFGEVFGVTGNNANINSGSSVDFNQLGQDKRDNEVVARASRVQNFYQASTKPREGGFSQFA